MKSFKQHLNEMSYDDIFKRDNKQRFIKKAVAGELYLNDGSLLPPISPEGEIVSLLSTDAPLEDIRKELQLAVKNELKVAISSIDKAANEFSGNRGSGAYPTSAEWEQIICTSYNMKSKNVEIDEAKRLAGVESSWKEKFDRFILDAHNINQNSFKSFSGIMEHYGLGSAKITKKWDKYFIETTGKPAGNKTRTPKTDMFIGNKKISLKKFGGAQLMSGGKAETLATLAFAYESLPDSEKTKTLEKQFNSIMKNIEKKFIRTKLPAGVTIRDLRKQIKTGDESGLIGEIKKTISDHEKINQSLNSIFENKELKKKVVRESITGEHKFSDKMAICTHLMKFDESGRGEFEEITDSVISHYAERANIYVSFKTTGGGSFAWSAQKIGYSEEYDVWKPLLLEAMDKTDKYMLTENILDITIYIKKFINFLWESIKKAFTKSLGYILKLFNLKIEVNDPIIKI